MILENEVSKYLYFCQYQKQLETKTIRAYRTDLEQFINFMQEHGSIIGKENLNSYIVELHKGYKQKSVKRKIASIKAFYSYLETEEIIENNPFHSIKTKFKEELILPKTIQKENIELLLYYLYHLEYENVIGNWRNNLVLRDIAVVELLLQQDLEYQSYVD